MYLGSDNYLGSTAYLGPGPNSDIEPIGDETLIQWRDITLHGLMGRFTIADLAGWDDLPDSRQQWDPRPNQHGVFDAPVLSGERHVMIAGNCFSKEQRDLLLRELKRAMTYGPHAEQLTVTHAGLRLSVAARLVRFNATYINWDEGAYGWQAEWVAPDPYRYGAKRMVYTGLPIKRGGLRYPLFTNGEGSSVVRTNYVTAPRPRPGITAGWSGGAGIGEPGPDGVAGLYRVTGSDTFAAATATVSLAAEDQAVLVSVQVRSSVAVPVSLVVSAGGMEVGDPVTLTPDTWAELAFEKFAAGAITQATVQVATFDGGQVPLPEGETLDVTMAYVSTDPGEYFDGASTLGDGLEGRWTGPAWESTSQLMDNSGVVGYLDYGPASDSGRVTLTNNGTADAWPTFAVRGPAPQGATITNVETGRRIVSTTVIPSGSTLTIHTAKGTAYLDGADRSGQLTVREWTSIPPESEYTFQFSAPTYTSAALVASVRDTHW